LCSSIREVNLKTPVVGDSKRNQHASVIEKRCGDDVSTVVVSTDANHVDCPRLKNTDVPAIHHIATVLLWLVGAKRVLRTLFLVLRQLIDPLWPVMVALAIILVTQWQRLNMQRWARIGVVTALGSLWMLSTPIGALILERPLVTESALELDWAPDYIYVLAGGFELGDTPAQDSSGLETTRRVNQAAELWRRYPTAVLVMAGSQPGMAGVRDARQQGLLMQTQAESLGVPAEKIIIESQSLNTNGHAKVARDSGLHEPDDPIAIVTSDFHLRRSRREFSRFFSNLRMIGSDPEVTDSSFGSISLGSLFPKVDSLRDSTIHLREYVALLLSDLRN
jgi:uncharacterized SAM-binding protein YcdF (DUF218 family)